MQGHVPSSVLCKVKHVRTLFAELGPLQWKCSCGCYCRPLTWALFRTSRLGLLEQALKRTCLLAATRACCLSEVHSWAKRQPVVLDLPSCPTVILVLCSASCWHPTCGSQQPCTAGTPCLEFLTEAQQKLKDVSFQSRLPAPRRTLGGSTPRKTLSWQD